MDNKIIKCAVQMYTMGTGDCLLLLFKNKSDVVIHKMLIDCGVIQISRDDIKPYIENLKEQVDGEIDTLLITHEHQDHVLGFQRAEDLFDQIKIKKLWLGWPEDEDDSFAKKLKEEYGLQKMALAAAYNETIKASKKKKKTNKADFRNDKFSNSLSDFVALNCEMDAIENGDLGLYKGDLTGFKIVKDKFKERDHDIRYLNPGEVIKNISGLKNIKIHVLGPPKDAKLIKKVHGDHGETYEHNNPLEEVRGFSNLTHLNSEDLDSPFDEVYIQNQKIDDNYNKRGNEYRKIDHDWLRSTANLALRLKKGINNLSVVLAIEFVDSGKIMLFPGDAEYGSWKSWQDIEWREKNPDGEKLTTENILNRTVFYKIAHHMSHNGTAKEIGTEMMTHKDLVAMGTVAYNKIGESWKNTMPNKELIKDLLNKTKGRLIMMDCTDMFADKAATIPLKDAIEKKQKSMSTRARKKYLKKNKVLMKQGDLLSQDDPIIDTNNIVAKQYTVDGR